MTRTMSQAERQAWLDEARYTANAMAAAVKPYWRRAMARRHRTALRALAGKRVRPGHAVRFRIEMLSAEADGLGPVEVAHRLTEQGLGLVEVAHRLTEQGLGPVETLQSDRFWERVHVQAGLPAPAIAYSGEVRA